MNLHRWRRILDHMVDIRIEQCDLCRLVSVAPNNSTAQRKYVVDTYLTLGDPGCDQAASGWTLSRLRGYGARIASSPSS